MTKPFHLAELNARIKAVLRRGKYGGDEVIKFHEIKIDTKSKSAFNDDIKMTLTKKEYDLLVFFKSNRETDLANEIITKYLKNKIL